MPDKFIALSFVHALMIEEAWLNDYLERNQLASRLGPTLSELRFLLNVPLIGKTVSFAVVNKIQSGMVMEQFPENRHWKINELNDLYIIRQGGAVISYRGKEILSLHKSDFFGSILNIRPAGTNYDVLVKKGSEVCKIPEPVVLQIPNVLWKVLEVNGKRDLLCSLSK